LGARVFIGKGDFMINNDSTSIGLRAVRSDKPAPQKTPSSGGPPESGSGAAGTAAGVVDAAAVTISVVPGPSETASLDAATVDKIVDSKAVSDKNDIKEDTLVASEDVSVELNQEQKMKVVEAIANVEEYMQDNQRTLNFEMAEKENRVIITVIDQQTNEVIRQIPPEDLVRMSNAINSGDSLAQGGILIHSKA